MKLDGDYLFEAPVDEVWSALFDPVVLAAVMPGCEKLSLVDGHFVGDLNIKVGPVQGKFSGKVELKDVDEPKSYTMVIDGRGAPGFVKAIAGVKLEADGANTRMRYDADAQIGGKMASVGQRLLEASARAISKQSLEGLHENIKIRSEAAAQAKARTKAKAEAAAKAQVEAEVEAKAEPEPEPETDIAAKVEAKAEGEAEVKPEPKPPPREETPSEPPPPPVLKTVDQKALAASVAREVTKSLLPAPVMIAIAIGVVAVVLWLVFRTAG
jgi:carbon monoxide dehydrogenase subunit G